MSSPSQVDADFEDLELSDDEYVSHKRLESLLKWYDRVLERTDEIENAAVQGQLSRNQADILVANVVTQYVEDALKTLKGKGLSNYLYANDGNYALGTVRVEAPTVLEAAWQQARPPERIGPDPPENPAEMPAQYSIVDGNNLHDRAYKIVGLQGFADAPTEFTESYEVAIRGPNGENTHTLSASTVMPRTITKNAFRTTNTLLNQLDIDIDLDAHQHGVT